MGSKLYVGGLPYSVTGDRLQEIFSEHGTVESANVISDKFTGQSRGFGFVEMSSSSEAQKAIDSLNGTQFDGRTLTVNEAKPMAKRENFGGGGGNRGGGGGRGNRDGGGGGATAGSFFVSELTAKRATIRLPFFLISRRYHQCDFPWKTFSRPVHAVWNCFLLTNYANSKPKKFMRSAAAFNSVGDFFLCYRVNLESRIASRVFWQVASGVYRSEDDMYRTAFALPWTDWFDPARTLRVDVSATKSPLDESQFRYAQNQRRGVR